MVLISSAQRKTTPGGHQEEFDALIKIRRGPRSLSAQVRLGMGIASASTRRPGSRLYASDFRSQISLGVPALARGRALCKIPCASGRAGKRRRAPCRKIPITK